MIYLDHNGTTPIAPEVADAMVPFMGATFGNPSSSHRLGQTAKNALGEARQEVAELLGCAHHEIVFTSGGTESNNMVIKGVSHTLQTKGRHIITSAIEHPSVTNPCLFLMSHGYDVTFLPVDSMGLVSPDSVRKAIRSDTVLISIMHANNETGTIQPLREIGKVARAADVYLHTDAAQSAGKIPTNVTELNVDFLTVAGHKIYAPKGVGALFVRNGIKLEPIMHGAGQEFGKRAGTENVMFAIGLAKACRLAKKNMPGEEKRIRRLTDRLQQHLSEAIPELVLNGHPTKRLPNTLNVSFPDVNGSALLDAVPDLYASTGAACHDRSVTLSHVLAAMQVPQDVGRGAVRLTLGKQNTESQIEEAATLLIYAYKELRAGD